MDNELEKLKKKAIRDKQKRIKPNECQKYIRLVIDNEIISSSLGPQLLEILKNSELKYEIRSLAVKKVIIWERSVGQRELVTNLDTEYVLNDEWQEENQLLQIINQQELEEAIRKDKLSIIGEHLHTAFTSLKHTIIVLCNNEKRANSNTICNALVELQLLQHINSQQIAKDAAELFAVLKCFTKSIAEAPYKQQKSETLGCFKKYLANDKKQCVRVVGRNGLGRMWQQHLTRLPLVTLDVAECLIAEYSCPRKLLKEYEENTDAVNKIADLKINRTGGPQPLHTDRRIGKVMSTKLHTLYHTRDPNALV